MNSASVGRANFESWLENDSRLFLVEALIHQTLKDLDLLFFSVGCLNTSFRRSKNDNCGLQPRR